MGSDPQNGLLRITTSQQLRGLVKFARDIVRKDKGLNGDLDRLPMLTWVMFLKFLDGMEQILNSKPSWRARSSDPQSSRRIAGVIGPQRKTA